MERANGGIAVCAKRTNPSTGHPELSTFLAVHFARETLSKLNLDNIDPAEAMKNFPHRIAHLLAPQFPAPTAGAFPRGSSAPEPAPPRSPTA
jgi:hypothetical protein